MSGNKKENPAPVIERDCVEPLFDSKFLHVYDLKYAPGRHYYDARRRQADELAAVKNPEEFRNMIPDAVSCFVILLTEGMEPRILLSREYRYPAGRFLLSVPAGLIDPADMDEESPALTAAAREIHEETGLTLGENDRIKLVNPFVFSTPGMTDESNALVCALIHVPDEQTLVSALTQEGAVGSEKFDGFVLMDREQALRTLADGRDGEGNFYPVYTWMALMYFLSGMWREE